MAITLLFYSFSRNPVAEEGAPRKGGPRPRPSILSATRRRGRAIIPPPRGPEFSNAALPPIRFNPISAFSARVRVH